MNKLIIILIITLTPLAVFARGHGGHGHASSGGGSRIDYHFPGVGHYTYRPFNPRSY
jgi:hypothetical protein